MTQEPFPSWPDVAADLVNTAAGRTPAEMIITGGIWVNVHTREAVSYTHLTLPTIYSV